MNLEQLLGRLKSTPDFMQNVTHWEVVPAHEAQYEPFPDTLDPRIPPVLANRGIYKLYSHQRRAFDLAAEKKDICVVTPTASGKTMCYNLPVLNTIMHEPDARALYLFPTKALSADQVAELYELTRSAGAEPCGAVTQKRLSLPELNMAAGSFIIEKMPDAVCS